MRELLRRLREWADGKKTIGGLIVMVLCYLAHHYGLMPLDAALPAILSGGVLTGVGVADKAEKARREAEGIRHSLQDVARSWDNVAETLKAQDPVDPPEVGR